MDTAPGAITALLGIDDDRAYYTFCGDLSQMGTIEQRLRGAGFNVVKNNVYPGFPKDAKEEYLRALKYVWEHKVDGWWNQKDALFEHGICTKQEFNDSIGRY